MQCLLNPEFPNEAHRSQYGFGGKVNEKTGEMSYGFASNLRDALPNASFIGFTSTPIKKTGANTRAVLTCSGWREGVRVTGIGRFGRAEGVSGWVESVLG